MDEKSGAGPQWLMRRRTRMLALGAIVVLLIGLALRNFALRHPHFPLEMWIETASEFGLLAWIAYLIWGARKRRP